MQVMTREETLQATITKELMQKYDLACSLGLMPPSTVEFEFIVDQQGQIGRAHV
jgi:hypothetical protein